MLSDVPWGIVFYIAVVIAGFMLGLDLPSAPYADGFTDIQHDHTDAGWR